MVLAIGVSPHESLKMRARMRALQLWLHDFEAFRANRFR
jgi:hypothetical protein